MKTKLVLAGFVVLACCTLPALAFLGTRPTSAQTKTPAHRQAHGDGADDTAPMPWQAIGTLPDEGLTAVFAYLKSLQPVKNAVAGVMTVDDYLSKQERARGPARSSAKSRMAV